VTGRRHGPGLHPSLRELPARERPESSAPDVLASLRPRERLIVAAIAAGKSAAQAARDLGLHERSVRKALARPLVSAAVEAETSRLYRDAIDALRRAAPAAAEVLLELLAGRPAIRLAAARAVLAQAAPKAPTAGPVAIAVNAASASDAAFSAALQVMSESEMRELRRDLLNRLGIRRPGPEYSAADTADAAL
jgi:hypothetical protein